MGGSPPGSAGVPPAQILPQLRPSPSPESTGSGALPLLRPGPCGSRRQGGRLQHRRETERQPKGQHAGGTPALPGGVVPMVRWGRYPAGDFSESRPVPFGKLPFACEPGARPPRLGRSIEKDYKWNIDAQDAQDNQDGRLLHETLTRAMIACGFEDVREHKPAVSGKNPVHPVHRCESKIYPCLTMNRFPATRRRGLFQVSPAPATKTVRIIQGERGVFQCLRCCIHGMAGKFSSEVGYLDRVPKRLQALCDLFRMLFSVRLVRQLLEILPGRVLQIHIVLLIPRPPICGFSGHIL